MAQARVALGCNVVADGAEVEVARDEETVGRLDDVELETE